jgi:RNA polymerase sigma factor (sigma-70 family)
MTNYDESDDFLWINETLRGNVHSFSNIILKYQDRIYTLVVRSIKNREDAKDITQNVFVNAFSSLKKFKKQSSLGTWLYRIAINQVKNYWRSNKNKFVIAESELKAFIDEKGSRRGEIADAERAFESEELKHIVNDLISFLPMDQRQIFVLYYITGNTCQEIAAIFKTTPSNVKIQLFRGRQYLFNRFKNIFK